MSHEQISIRTADGACPAHIFKPGKSGSWPAIVFYMDGLAIRPQLFAMAKRLADSGFVVLLPDLFYRFGPYQPLDAHALFTSGMVREATKVMLASTDNLRAAQDTAAFLECLDERKDVSSRTVGVTGYCMGGAIAMTAAGTYPDRIKAVASFHGGYLATDADDSPHLLASAIKARIYIGEAVEDPSYPPEMAARLKRALSDAQASFRCETYEGARHGWTMADFPVYDEIASERHWRRLLKLFHDTLR